MIIFGDSIVNFNRQIKYEINKGLQSEKTRFKYFPGATSEEFLQYIHRILEDQSVEVTIIHIGVNDIISNRSSPDSHVLKNIKNIVIISGLFPTICITEDVIAKVNKSIKDICGVERCFYVSNDDVTDVNLFKDVLHLLENGKQILTNNFAFNVNKNFLIPGTFHPTVHLTAA